MKVLAISGWLFVSILAPVARSECKAILFSGGFKPYFNHIEFLKDLKNQYAGLIRRNCQPQDIYILSASGKSGAKDFVGSAPDPSGRQLVAADYSFYQG